jgi:hypothetical protein
MVMEILPLVMADLFPPNPAGVLRFFATLGKCPYGPAS